MSHDERVCGSLFGSNPQDLDLANSIFTGMITAMEPDDEHEGVKEAKWEGQEPAQRQEEA